MKESLRSFLVVCSELNIPDLEYITSVAGMKINHISVQQWADMDTKQFILESASLDETQKKTLKDSLRSCVLSLR